MAYLPFTKETEEKFGLTITSHYGPRTVPYTGFHTGVDWAPSKYRNGRIELIASEDGILENFTDKNGALCSYLKANSGKGYMCGHCKEFIAKNGPVKAGDVIAIMGNSGKTSTGKHVHFRVHTNYGDWNSHVDPLKQELQYFNVVKSFEEELGEAVKWNDAVYEKYGIRLLKKIDGANITREELIIVLHRFKDYLQKSPHV